MPAVDGDANAQGDDANNGEDRVIETSGQSLDDAHAIAQRTFEEEDRKAAADDANSEEEDDAEDVDGDDGDAADDAADKKDGDGDADKSKGAAGDGEGSDNGDAAGTGDDDGAGKGSGADTADYKPGSAGIPKAEELKAPEAPKIDEDVSKPGDYKVEFTDIDGNKYYVSSASQLPEDFEPKSQRDYGISLESLSEQRAKYATDKKEYETSKADFDNKSTISELQQGWHTEIQTMTESKALPEKKEDRDKVVGGVFKLMNDELEKGNAIDSFAIAHELYMARTGRVEADAAAAEKDKAEKADRKRKGGKVLGGGSRSSAGGGSSGGGGDSSQGRVLEAPPPGTSLDDVHARVMNGVRR